MWVTKVNYEARRLKKQYQNAVSELQRYQATINQEMNQFVYNANYGGKKIARSMDVGGAYEGRYRNKESEWNRKFTTIKSEIESFQKSLSEKISSAQSLADHYASEEYYEEWEDDDDD